MQEEACAAEGRIMMQGVCVSVLCIRHSLLLADPWMFYDLLLRQEWEAIGSTEGDLCLLYFFSDNSFFVPSGSMTQESSSSPESISVQSTWETFLFYFLSPKHNISS